MFLVAVDGGRFQPTSSPYTWRLHPGRNTLRVDCENEFGNRGVPSEVVLRLGGCSPGPLTPPGEGV